MGNGNENNNIPDHLVYEAKEEIPSEESESDAVPIDVKEHHLRSPIKFMPLPFRLLMACSNLFGVLGEKVKQK